VDEGGGGHIFIAIVYQGHLTLKIVSIILQALLGFHLYCKGVVVAPLEFPLRSKLVKKTPQSPHGNFRANSSGANRTSGRRSP